MEQQEWNNSSDVLKRVQNADARSIKSPKIDSTRRNPPQVSNQLKFARIFLRSLRPLKTPTVRTAEMIKTVKVLRDFCIKIQD